MSTTDDIRWLTALTAGEMTLANAYDRAVKTAGEWQASDAVITLLKMLAGHERLHAEALQQAGAPLAAPGSGVLPDNTYASLQGFADAITALERIMAQAYVQAAAVLSSPSLAEAAALAGAAEAEHEALLKIELAGASPSGAKIEPITIEQLESRLRALGWTG